MTTAKKLQLRTNYGATLALGIIIVLIVTLLSYFIAEVAVIDKINAEVQFPGSVIKLYWLPVISEIGAFITYAIWFFKASKYSENSNDSRYIASMEPKGTNGVYAKSMRRLYVAISVAIPLVFLFLSILLTRDDLSSYSIKKEAISTLYTTQVILIIIQVVMNIFIYTLFSPFKLVEAGK